MLNASHSYLLLKVFISLIFPHAEKSKFTCGAVTEATTSDFNACALVPSVSS